MYIYFFYHLHLFWVRGDSLINFFFVQVKKTVLQLIIGLKSTAKQLYTTDSLTKGLETKRLFKLSLLKSKNWFENMI